MSIIRHRQKQIVQLTIFPALVFESIHLWRNMSDTKTEIIRLGKNILSSIPSKPYTRMIQIKHSISQFHLNPCSLFHVLLLLLLSTGSVMKWFDRRHSQRPQMTSKRDDTTSAKQQQENNLKPALVKSLQWRFLPVFWLLRIAFWMSGPYFYPVYASKIVNGKPMTMAMINQIFLVGFTCIALLGPMAGRLMDQYGRKKGTISAAIVYALGAFSTQSSTVSVLFIGRALGGIGTSLMGSAPEAWIICEFEALGQDMSRKWLPETFGWAFSMDSILAIAAGQLSSFSARSWGPTGPFQLSPIFLAIAAGITSLFWSENIAQKQNSSLLSTEGVSYKSDTPSIRNALDVVMTDPKLVMLGAIQSLFESSMYIFVMIWPRAMNAVIQDIYGTNVSTPYGTIFSGFMACCMFGSSVFGKMAKRSILLETSCIGMLIVAFLSLMGAAICLLRSSNNLVGLIITFFVFEACVGMYFPSIGMLRSRLLPNSHRSVIMTLFSVPLNVLVVSVFLSIDRIGMVGAMFIAAMELGLATVCMTRLRHLHLAKVAKN